MLMYRNRLPISPSASALKPNEYPWYTAPSSMTKEQLIWVAIAGIKNDSS